MGNRTHLKAIRVGLVTLVSAMVLVFWFSIATVSGQQDDEVWSSPLNLSASGSAGQPEIISSSDGAMLLYWQDSVENSFLYSLLVEGEWSQPQSAEPPFGTREYFPDLAEDEPTPLFWPVVATDPVGNLHATWIDDDGVLFYSRAPFNEFDSLPAWLTPTVVASATVQTALMVENELIIDVVYFQSDDVGDSPSGLYFRRSTDSGENWNEPVPILLSPYYQLLSPETANVQIARDDRDRIYVSWDDWPRLRILMARSYDDGLSWHEPIVIDRPQEDDGEEAISPGGVRLVARDRTLHTIWWAGHDGIECGVYHQWSDFSGSVWSERQTVLQNTDECPVDLALINGDHLVMIADTHPGRYLSVWDGTQWTEPLLQPEINGFTDPENFGEVLFDCGQDFLLRGDELLVASCGQALASDVWLNSRSLANLLSPVVIDQIWQTPYVMSEVDTTVLSPLLIADEAERIHAFWNMLPMSEGSTPDVLPASIEHSRWDQGRWSRNVSLLNSPSGPAVQAAVAVDGEGRIVAAWSGGDRGAIFFSRVGSDNAAQPSEWSTPLRLSPPSVSASAPAIAIDSANVIYVVYTVSLNEGRGLYLVKSEDNGESWTEPDFIFDAEAAGWEMAAEPRLVASGPGHLHVLLLHRRASSIFSPRDVLHYSQSSDGGENWTTTQIVSADTQQGVPKPWHAVAAVENGLIHRVWQEWSTGRLTLWHQYSADGVNWQQPLQITSYNVIDVPAALALDSEGHPHLVFAVHQNLDGVENQVLLRHLQWQNRSWQEVDSLAVEREVLARIQTVAASVSPSGRLAVLAAGQSEEPGLSRLIFTMREIEVVPGQDVAVPAATPVPSVAVETETVDEVSDQSSPEPTPTLMVTREVPAAVSPTFLGPLSLESSIAVIALVFVILLGFPFLVLFVRRHRSRQ